MNILMRLRRFMALGINLRKRQFNRMGKKR